MKYINKNCTKILSLIILLSMFFSMSVIYAEGAQADESVSATAFGIEKKLLCAGDELVINNPSGYELKLFAGGSEVAPDGFVLTEDHYEKWIEVRAFDGGEQVDADRVYFSRLPVLYINTDDGLPVTSKIEYKSGSMTVQNSGGAPYTSYDGAVSIKGRGNLSWGMPKKPYRIKLNKKTDMFGMGSNKNWVLINNYTDECFLRNTTARQIAARLGLEYMDNTWTTVVFNGEYAGNYLLCEQIRIDETRVDIYDWEEAAKDLASIINKAEKKRGNKIDKDALEDELKTDLSWVTGGSYTINGNEYSLPDYDISGGYLFELSEEYDEVSKFTLLSGLKIMVKSPEYLNTNQAMMSYVKNYWQSFENAYKSEDGYAETENGRKHYTRLADIDSMVSFWLVNEIMGNLDMNKKSRYAYLDKGGKIKFGPVWDFDWGCGTSVAYTPYYGWVSAGDANTQSFFKEWLDDPMFVAKATEQYWKIRPYLEALVEDDGVLDSESAYLKESGLADEARWNRRNYSLMKNNARGYLSDTGYFKKFLADRIGWLDSQFESDKKLLDSTRDSHSSYPYTRDDDALSIDILNKKDDFITPENHAKADAIVNEGQDVAVSIRVNDESTTSCKIYINGLEYGSADVKDGSADFVIQSFKLTVPEPGKNTISVTGKNAEGQTTCRSFATLISRGDVNTHIVSFEPNGGRSIVPQILYEDKPCTEPKNMFKDRHVFTGWYSDPDCNDRWNFDTAVTGDLTLYAGWVYDENASAAIGDVNFDGFIDVRDVTAIQRYLAEYDIIGAERLLFADINGDGSVTIEDSAELQLYIAGYDVSPGTPYRMPDGELLLTVKSNLFPDKCANYSLLRRDENDNYVTVTFTLDSDRDLLNTDWLLTYDGSLLKYCSATMPCAENEVINAAPASVEYSVKGNYTDLILSPLSDAEFVTVRFKIMGSGNAAVELNVSDLKVSLADEYGETIEAEERAVVRNGEVVADKSDYSCRTDISFEAAEKTLEELTVTAGSNLFPYTEAKFSSRSFDEGGSYVTLTYRLDSDYGLLNTDWLLTYDGDKLEYCSASMPCVYNEMINTSPGSVGFGIRGNYTDLYLEPLCDAEFIRVVFRIKEAGSTHVDLRINDLKLSLPDEFGETIEAEERSVIKDVEYISGGVDILSETAIGFRERKR